MAVIYVSGFELTVLSQTPTQPLTPQTPAGWRQKRMEELVDSGKVRAIA